MDCSTLRPMFGSVCIVFDGCISKTIVCSGSTVPRTYGDLPKPPYIGDNLKLQLS